MVSCFDFTPTNQKKFAIKTYKCKWIEILSFALQAGIVKG